MLEDVGSASSCARGRAIRASSAALGQRRRLVSAAARTKETFRRAFDGTAFAATHVESDLIYNGLHDVSAEDVLIDLAAIDPVTTSLLVVGHNPTVLELLARLVRDLPRPVTRELPARGRLRGGLPDDQQVGLGPYELVARYVPD